MPELEESIPIFICKLEHIFPLHFFNVMEHLIIHLSYEVLHHIKKTIKNKARVEGSICNAYLIEKVATFFSYYFEESVHILHKRVTRIDDVGILFIWLRFSKSNDLEELHKHQKGDKKGELSRGKLHGADSEAANLRVELRHLSYTPMPPMVDIVRAVIGIPKGLSLQSSSNWLEKSSTDFLAENPKRGKWFSQLKAWKALGTSRTGEAKTTSPEKEEEVFLAPWRRRGAYWPFPISFSNRTPLVLYKTVRLEFNLKVKGPQRLSLLLL
ncbi:hypothetical protein M9H77_18419 [Catharanthus roseus]|uniref:Uncharacterized protein n=1 Tax=Catharanthus roseus TaxID=4058 RepID=A0ACC0B7D9_CATRO|nr:hypothetical protein M9H77_18419 [Catharanthus roseus]